MPNYVYNTLIVTGKPEERQRFTDAIFVPRPTLEEVRANWNNFFLRDGELETEEGRERLERHAQKRWEESTDTLQILRSLFPCPKELDDSTSPPHGVSPEDLLRRLETYGAVDWFDWQRANWGGKWGDCSTEKVREGKRSTTLKYETAWTPLQKGFVAISKQFPALHFNCTWKEEDVHAGRYKFQNGELLENKEWRWR